MSMILALAALAGTTFQCSADTATFTIFAPDEEQTANVMGNVLTLYSVTGDGEIVPSSARISQVFDDMPNSLYIEMKSDEAKSIWRQPPLERRLPARCLRVR